MSEYQYYEFQALDRPLTEREQSTLRRYSSRATISAGRFSVDYSWGSFKGDASEWMEKYFDVFPYLSNWDTRELMLRLPRRVLPFEAVRLVEPEAVPEYQRLAAQAAQFRAAGWTYRRIGGQLGVSDKTVRRAIAWRARQKV